MVRATLEAQGDGDVGSARDVLAAQVVDAGADTPGTEAGASADGDSAGEVAGGAAPHEVTVVLAVPAGATPDATTAAQIGDLVEGPVSGFWSEQTGGRVSFDVVQQRDWMRLEAPCSDFWSMWKEVAGAVGFTSGAGKHLLVYVPSTGDLPGCYTGLGTVGTDGLASGGLSYVRSPLASLVAHELGHNLGLGHSDALLCPTTSDGAYSDPTWGNSCRQVSYRDYYDVMGASWGRFGTLSAGHADRLGLLGAGVQAVTSPATATLRPISGLSGLRALRVQDPGGGTYYVEFRPASGRDAYLASPCSTCPPLEPGVLVRRAVADDGTVLLDPTPSGSTGDWSQALSQGRVLVTASRRVQVRVDALTATGATVSVLVDGQDPRADELAPSPVDDTLPSFSDVPSGTYYYDAVSWSVGRAITMGTSATTFSPQSIVTRAQATTFLWRAKGQPAPGGSSRAFSDVPPGSYYEDAVEWASGEGITSGTSATTFSPYAQLTRQQAVTLLWRLAGKPDASGSTRFLDVPPSSYAATAIAWAAETGVTSGTSAATFSPQQPVSRAQMVTFLHRMLG